MHFITAKAAGVMGLHKLTVKTEVCMDYILLFTMFHLSGCLRSVSNSWWSACSSSSPPAYFLPNQKSCRPWPNALGGFPQPLKSFPCLVSTTVIATREGLEKVKMLSHNILPLNLNKNNNNKKKH